MITKESLLTFSTSVAEELNIKVLSLCTRSVEVICKWSNPVPYLFEFHYNCYLTNNQEWRRKSLPPTRLACSATAFSWIHPRLLLFLKLRFRSQVYHPLSLPSQVWLPLVRATSRTVHAQAAEWSPKSNSIAEKPMEQHATAQTVAVCTPLLVPAMLAQGLLTVLDAIVRAANFKFSSTYLQNYFTWIDEPRWYEFRLVRPLQCWILQINNIQDASSKTERLRVN